MGRAFPRDDNLEREERAMLVQDYPIEELELGVRAYNILKRMGVDTFGQLARVSAYDLQTWYDARGVDGLTQPAICGFTLTQIVDAQRTIAQLVSAA